MFIAALFTIVKTWKQTKCPLTDDWIKKMWYIFTMEYYSALKKEQNNAICSNMDGSSDSHIERSKSERERQIPYDITYNWNLISSTNEHLHKKENHGLEKQTCGCLMGEGGSGRDWELGLIRIDLQGDPAE